MIFMILTEYVEINLNPANRKHFKELGYDITQKVFKVLICHLTKGSHAKILVKCDLCDSEIIKVYGDYLKNFNNGGYYVCKKCQNHKSFKTNLKKFGFKSVAQSEQIKEKSKQISLEKYGFKCSSQNEEVKEKIKNTNLERYGGTLMGSPMLNKRWKQIILERYGVGHISQNVEVKEKTKNTNLERYGGTLMGSPILSKKIKKIFLEKYGVENPAQNLEIHNRIVRTSFLVKKFKETDLRYQGSYELDFLNKYSDSINIKNGMTIRYKFNDLKKIYFPDFYIKELNLIIEIKSQWTYDIYLPKNLAKQEQCLKDGYQYIFIIDKNYTEFEKLISN